jgi:hypothetical protein
MTASLSKYFEVVGVTGSDDVLFWAFSSYSAVCLLVADTWNNSILGHFIDLERLSFFPYFLPVLRFAFFQPCSLFQMLILSQQIPIYPYLA